MTEPIYLQVPVMAVSTHTCDMQPSYWWVPFGEL
jgi:hypothetical protein